MINNRTWRKYKSSIVFGGLILLTGLFSVNDMMDKAKKLGEVREQVTENTFANIRIKQNEESDRGLATIANQRMRRGCILVVDSSSAKNLVTLTEGQPVRDRSSKSYLPAGVTVCGANGETAVLRNNAQGIPVISDIAVGDRQLVYDNLARVRGAKVYYNTPEVNDEIQPQ